MGRASRHRVHKMRVPVATEQEALVVFETSAAELANTTPVEDVLADTAPTGATALFQAVPGETVVLYGVPIEGDDSTGLSPVIIAIAIVAGVLIVALAAYFMCCRFRSCSFKARGGAAGVDKAVPDKQAAPIGHRQTAPPVAEAV